MAAVRLGGSLKELRIHLCQTSAQSAGVRGIGRISASGFFNPDIYAEPRPVRRTLCTLNKNYVNIKKQNPNFPILIRECNGIQPRIWARYEKGVEQSMPLTNLTASDVFSALKQLVK